MSKRINTKVCEIGAGGCGQEFVLGRGRPPLLCPACRTLDPDIEEKQLRQPLSSKQKVDKLERMLKERGLHVQQHRRDLSR